MIQEEINRLEPINLVQIARNESARMEYRQAAVEKLLELDHDLSPYSELDLIVAITKATKLANEKPEEVLVDAVPVVEDEPVDEDVDQEEREDIR